MIDAVELERYPADFIDTALIDDLLREAKPPSAPEVAGILAHAREAKGISLSEAAQLLLLEDPELLAEVYATARLVKERIYGKRMVFFAPLYISDYCVNNCVYCGYRHRNEFPRRRLTLDEVRQEVRILESLGHKRLALEAGEDPVHCPIDYVLDVIGAIYETTEDHGEIRRVNVNIAATTVAEYRLLKAAKIGTYVLFQETYHPETYRRMHPSGPKSNYAWHLTAMDRAMEAGIDDVGLGVLFGLYDYRFEVLALLLHARHLEERFGVGPHTISVPRLRPARGVTLDKFPYLVGDEQFKKVVAVLRLAVPYTGMILSTRERPGYRDEVLALGISQLSAGSCTGVGGYRQEYGHDHRAEPLLEHLQDRDLAAPAATAAIPGTATNGTGTCAARSEEAAQFTVEDRRSPDEMIRSLCQGGFLPSFCTACYRRGRTGDRFMRLAKTGQIQNICQPNAILTFKEYLLDYASAETRELGEQVIATHLQEIGNQRVKEETLRRLRRLEQGERDLYF
ncbi:MAG TPA: [FeFe] hydrogenase H-cluster radical SAM maturase HydG [Firmicutes bacterium]|nr:[FeFe] hydrogenase H-cluster radical SAM maturase HydG [Bacillota bacterium]